MENSKEGWIVLTIRIKVKYDQRVFNLENVTEEIATEGDCTLKYSDDNLIEILETKLEV